MENEKQTFNQKMDRYIATVKGMTQEQVDACAYVMGSSGWSVLEIINELNDEKHDE